MVSTHVVIRGVDERKVELSHVRLGLDKPDREAVRCDIIIDLLIAFFRSDLLDSFLCKRVWEAARNNKFRLNRATVSGVAFIFS